MDNVKCSECGFEYQPRAALKAMCPHCVLRIVVSDDAPVNKSNAGTSPPVPFQPPRISELAPHLPELEILELIGHGGMSAVYKARQTKLDRIVAVKILPQEVAERHGGFERFTREAKALARLTHPNIVALYDMGQAGPWCYFLMEYVDGPNLRQLIGGEQHPPKDVLAIVRVICEALQYAHDHGVVHRDVKPENILLDKRGTVKIADFGLAKLTSVQDEPNSLTRTWQAVGTPSYMAPEQMEEPWKVDHRADIYSLGVVLYEMLTGELPVGRFEAPSSKVDVDVRIDEVVLRSLAREPERRYQHVKQVRSDVMQISSNPEDVRALAQPAPQRKSFHVILATFTIGLILASIALLFESKRYFKNGWITHRDPTLDYVDASIYCGASILCVALAFVVARFLVSSAKTANDFSLGQWMASPVLFAGYLLLGIALVLAPALWMLLTAAVPMFTDARSWDMFGQFYRADRDTWIFSKYWLTSVGAAALVSSGWCLLLTFIARWRPQPFARLFHPAGINDVRTIFTYVCCIGVIVFLPIGVLFSLVGNLP